MTGHDLSAVECIEKAGFPCPWSLESITAACRDDLAFVIEAEGAVAGYLFARPVLDEAELFTLAVASGYRRRGFARALLLHLFEVLRGRGCCRVFLELRPSNTAARALYQASGFRALATRKGYYSNGEDALVMSAEIV
ncbi:MAG: ribosomal protein S18-alanine N-acetyltransferase [Fibrobacterota bacterium]